MHHILLLVSPLYLHQVYSGHEQNNNNQQAGHNNHRQILRNPFNLSWLFHAYGVWILGHLLIIQPISYLTSVNINVTLCPQRGVPGYGENYRLHSLYWNVLFMTLSAVIYAVMTRAVSLILSMLKEWNAKSRRRIDCFNQTKDRKEE